MTSHAGVLIGRDRIAERVSAMGAEIARDLDAGPGDPAEPAVIIPVLTGALVFTADLIRAMPTRMAIHPVTVSSYRGKATTAGALRVEAGVPDGLRGRRVLIVDDILDTGQTLAALREAAAAQAPAWLRICVLLRKDKPRRAEVRADYAGFDIPDVFVVGYGLDYDGLERNRPDIVELRGEGAR